MIKFTLIIIILIYNTGDNYKKLFIIKIKKYVIQNLHIILIYFLKLSHQGKVLPFPADCHELPQVANISYPHSLKLSSVMTLRPVF